MTSIDDEGSTPEKEPPRYWGSDKGDIILAIARAKKALTIDQIVERTKLSWKKAVTAISTLLQMGNLSFHIDDDTYTVDRSLYREYRRFIRKPKRKRTRIKSKHREMANSKIQVAEAGGVRVIGMTACGTELAKMGILSDRLEATPDGIRKRIKEVEFVLSNSKEVSKDTRLKLVGAIGELWTLEALLNLDDRHVVINNVQLSFDPPFKLKYKTWGSKYVCSAKIDHVVMGPIGAVAIESKFWKQETLDAIRKSGGFDPYAQVMRTRRVLKHFLRTRMTSKPPWVYALVSISGARPFKSKKVVAPEGLCKRIMRGSRTTQEQIEEAVYLLTGTQLQNHVFL
ncbi:MAG: nuclease-related domain-containing protein [Candidatus Thorarchaeota archaeon]